MIPLEPFDRANRLKQVDLVCSSTRIVTQSSNEAGALVDSKTKMFSSRRSMKKSRYKLAPMTRCRKGWKNLGKNVQRGCVITVECSFLFRKTPHSLTSCCRAFAPRRTRVGLKFKDLNSNWRAVRAFDTFGCFGSLARCFQPSEIGYARCGIHTVNPLSFAWITSWECFFLECFRYNTYNF